MKKIILASGSPQRKKLLDLTGITFKVIKSDADEIQTISSSCAALVKKNALIKARDIAAKQKSGIIIGADTVVYIGQKKLVLKPKDLKDAKRILKVLMSRPQWIYTGVAIIDVDKKQEYVDYEKTKVFMSKMNDNEIDIYHKKVSPLDKAGGFDIEGLGSVFIHRIEGCYTNVIGLPMAKLRLMLKKVGVGLLSLTLMATLAGCTTEYNVATKQQEYFIFSTEKEVSIGASIAHKINTKYEIFEGVEENKRVEKIFEKVVEACDRKDIVYFIKIIDRKEVNASALPGGYIYLFKGVIDLAENDDQIAGVIAHEIGHITAKHGLKRLQASYGALLLQLAAIETKSNVSAGVQLATTSLFMEHSQDHELEADKLGIKYMEKAGYDPNEMIKFLDKMKKDQDKLPLRRFSYWRTHPHIPERMANMNQIIKGEMDFRDYIRLIDRVDNAY